jgi:hypothetical protein
MLERHGVLKIKEKTGHRSFSLVMSDLTLNINFISYD